MSRSAAAPLLLLLPLLLLVACGLACELQAITYVLGGPRDHLDGRLPSRGALAKSAAAAASTLAASVAAGVQWGVLACPPATNLAPLMSLRLLHGDSRSVSRDSISNSRSTSSSSSSEPCDCGCGYTRFECNSRSSSTSSSSSRSSSTPSSSSRSSSCSCPKCTAYHASATSQRPVVYEPIDLYSYLPNGLCDDHHGEEVTFVELEEADLTGDLATSRLSESNAIPIPSPVFGPREEKDTGSSVGKDIEMYSYVSPEYAHEAFDEAVIEDLNNVPQTHETETEDQPESTTNNSTSSFVVDDTILVLPGKEETIDPENKTGNTSIHAVRKNRNPKTSRDVKKEVRGESDHDDEWGPTYVLDDTMIQTEPETEIVIEQLAQESEAERSQSQTRQETKSATTFVPTQEEENAHDTESIAAKSRSLGADHHFRASKHLSEKQCKSRGHSKDSRKQRYEKSSEEDVKTSAPTAIPANLLGLIGESRAFPAAGEIIIERSRKSQYKNAVVWRKKRITMRMKLQELSEKQEGRNQTEPLPLTSEIESEDGGSPEQNEIVIWNLVSLLHSLFSYVLG